MEDEPDIPSPRSADSQWGRHKSLRPLHGAELFPSDGAPIFPSSAQSMDYPNRDGRASAPASDSSSQAPAAANEAAPNDDENDTNPDWAVRAGQGPTQVERVARRDALARGAITEALLGLLYNRFTAAPLAIGLFGEWGSGKSSQINFLKERLKHASPGKPTVRVVEFNAWEHEKCDNLTAALAQSVVEHLIHGTTLTQQWSLARRLEARKRAHVVAAARRDLAGLPATVYRWVAPFISPELAFAVVIVLLLMLTRLPTDLKTLASGSALLIGGWKALNKYVTANLTNWFKRIASGAGGGPFGLPDFGEKLGSFHEIRQTLADLVALRIEGGENASTGEYLLIVVDDLDRCSVATIKLVLDAVRLVTNMPRVVTMVAIDDRLAFPAVESFFEQFKGSGRDASAVSRDYLTKVFNVSISLPRVPAVLAAAFIAEHLFADVHSGGAEDDDGALGAPVADASGPSLAADGMALASPAEIEAFSRLALSTGMTNPRVLWRMKQAWYLLRKMILSFGEARSPFDPWMRSMFVREAILALPAAPRCEIDSWVRAVLDGACPHDVPASIPPELAGLLRQDLDGMRERWPYVDIVLLPAAPVARQC